MRELETPWGTIDATRALVVLVGSFVVLRTALATQSAFGFHQGWNEGHYALIAHGFLSHPLVPTSGEQYVYNVPPLFPYLVAASFAAFGESTLAARLPSVVAGGAALVATYALGRETYGDRLTALYGAVTLALLPFFQLYAGRAQTDVTMLALFTGSLAAIARGYGSSVRPTRWLALGGVLFAGAFAAKQPAVLLPAIVVAWLALRGEFGANTVRRTGTLVAAASAALVPLAAWLFWNYRLNPTAFVSDWRHELLSRTDPFANVPLVVAVGLLLGVTPVVLALALGELSSHRRRLIELVRSRRGLLVWWLLVYGSFVLYRTPRGHQYYVVGLLPPIALLAGRGFRKAERVLRRSGREGVLTLLVVGLLLNAAAGSLVLFELSGELSAAEGGGERVATDVARHLTERTSGATVLVPNEYGPPVSWYARDDPDVRVHRYRVSSLTERRVREVARNASTPVYVVYPRPAWEPLPLSREDVTVSHRTSAYEFTVMSAVGTVVRTDSKFAFYLDDRQLVVYRVSFADETPRSWRPTASSHSPSASPAPARIGHPSRASIG